MEEKITEKLDEKMSDCNQLGVRLRELQEREDRKTNIIIINIPESEKSTAERIEDDTAKIQAVLGEIKGQHFQATNPTRSEESETQASENQIQRRW